MKLPAWLQELKDAEAKVNEKREGFRFADLNAFEAAIADAGPRLIRIAEAADDLSLNFSWLSSTHEQHELLEKGFDKLRAALRGDEKPTS